MTTIDHKQAIEHCFQALGHPQGTRSSIAFVRGAEWAAEQLAAPATAPAQPEIVDLLAEMYELILANKVVLAEKSGGVWTWPDRAIEAVRKHRSGPAQPERKPKPFIGTRSAIYKCTDCGHEQSVQEIHTEYGVYVGSGANWCDKCGDGKPERKETP